MSNTTDTVVTQSLSDRSALAQGIAAARANLVPGAYLWGTGLAIVLLYYLNPAVRDALDVVARVKAHFGYAYSAVATAIFGGLLPFIYLRVNPRTRELSPWSYLWFYTFFWAYRGIEVDVLYRLQTVAFGEGHLLRVLLPKILVDQFVYNPLWGAPTTVVLFLWRDCGYDSAKTRSLFSWRYLWDNSVRMLVSTWMVWVPAVAIIYSFPGALQVPLFNLVLCFWMLLLSTLTGGKTPGAREGR